MKAYLFDIDGVLTDPQAKKIGQELFTEILKRLQEGCIVGFNTGRSLDFVMEEVLDPLEEKITDKILLQNVFAVGEKGAAWITYDNGKKSINIDEAISVPQTIQNEVRTLANQPEYQETMFYDDSKRSMVTLELKHGKTIAEFQEPQKRLVADFKILLQRRGLDTTYRVDPTTIATDIESIFVGKALGAKRFVELVEGKGMHPSEYICFGDSASDYDMHEELQRLGKKTLFVFVGKQQHGEGKSEKDVIFIHEKLDKGTLEFLQNEH